ncbi:MAG: M20 family metallopeptidase [Chloroflexota bacterium]
MINYDEYLPLMLALLKRLVETESPSHVKSAVDNVGKIIVEEAKSLGGKISIIQNETTGNHVVARFDPPASIKKNINDGGFLLLCHMDTVFPLGTLAHMPFHEKDGKILGPGVSDMKAGVVICLTVLRALLDNDQMPSIPITALFTSDEETGSLTSRKWIEELAKESQLVLVLEPGMPDGSIKTWRKGVGDFHIVVHGQAAHAGGNHENGRNAIEELSHQVLAIQGMTDYSRGTTLNVGVIQGGTVVNVVPETAWVDVDLRVMQPGEAERIIEVLNNLKPVIKGTSLEITGNLNRPPMPYNELMQSTFEHARKIAARNGIPLTAAGTGGASDANFVAPLGIPVLDGLGAIGGDYHSEKEYIIKDSLVPRARLLATLLQNW